jgi:hypothetical protein
VLPVFLALQELRVLPVFLALQEHKVLLAFRAFRVPRGFKESKVILESAFKG